MRILVADGPEPATPPERWIRVSDLVRRAADEMNEPLVLAFPGESDGLGPYDGSIHERSAAPEHWNPELALLVVEISMDRDESEARWIRSGDGYPDELLVFALNTQSGVEEITAWLTRNLATQLTNRERQMVEVVVAEVRRQLDVDAFAREDPDEVAVTTAAVETMEAQLRSPRPHRRILMFALGQLPGFVAGSLQGIAGNYLFKLLEALT